MQVGRAQQAQQGPQDDGQQAARCQGSTVKPAGLPSRKLPVPACSGGVHNPQPAAPIQAAELAAYDH
jgi:hypothetical protein